MEAIALVTCGRILIAAGGGRGVGGIQELADGIVALDAPGGI